MKFAHPLFAPPGRRRVTIAALCMVLPITLAGAGHASPLLTDAQKDAQVLEESALTNYWLLGSLFGVSAGTTLSLTAGTFSDTSWAFSLTGTYQAMSVDIAFSGSFTGASQSGSFISSGTVGSSAVNGQGNWSWTDTSPTEESLQFATSLTVPASQVENDLETVPIFGPKTYDQVHEDDNYIYLEDFGVLEVTVAGVPTGHTLMQFSREIDEKTGPEPPPPPPDNIMAMLGSSSLTASQSDARGTVSGSLTTTPEPSSLLLLGTGLAGLAGVIGLRQRIVNR